MDDSIKKNVELILSITDKEPVINVGDADSYITDISGYILSKDQKKSYNNHTGSVSQQLESKWKVYLEVIYSLDQDYGLVDYQQHVYNIIKHWSFIVG